MKQTALLAKHLRAVYNGKNWTAVDMKTTLADVTWEQATQKVGQLHTITALVYHIHYFVHHVAKYIEHGTLEAKDKYSFDHPPINSQEDWEQFLVHVWAEMEGFAQLIEQLPDEQLPTNFMGDKYGTWNKNLWGIVEHCHYHLGQIVLVKKMLA